MNASKSKILSCLILFVAGTDAGEPKMPDFSHYPQPHLALDDIVRQHMSGQFHGTSKDLRLAISVFYDNQASYSYFYGVTSTGEAYSWADIADWAISGIYSHRLSERSLKDLEDAIKTLPVENAYPPIGELAIVSLRNGASREVRTIPAATLKSAIAILYHTSLLPESK